jgi:membrane-associated phospholipid phosphatase
MHQLPCRLAFLLLSVSATLAGCDRGLTEPESSHPDAPLGRASAETAPAARASAVLAWNAIARDLVARYSTSPPQASRVYALLSVAQRDALLALSGARPGRGLVTAPPLSGPRAAVAAASAWVLSELFPQESDVLAAQARAYQETPARTGSGPPHPGLADAIALGEAAAEAVMAYARTDGADAVWSGTVPVGPGLWFSSLTPPAPPLLPLWGEVRPWFLESGSQFRPPPPPVFGSAEFLAALAEVRRFSDHRTPEQLRIALYWADGRGTYTPPGHWNAIAAGVIVRYQLDDLRAARVLALMNAAVMDAGISCWDAKYSYWLIRPSQVDPAITTPVGLPNFPSYTSGHSSFSAAAAEVLGHFFPAERRRLEAMAEEAAISRVYGGIHYRFDSEEALEQGRAIGRLAVERARAGRWGVD